MNIHELSALENASIRRFVQSAADDSLLSGRVLDYGAGREPYRDVVEAAGGTYEPYDRAEWPGGTGGDIGEHPGRGGNELYGSVLSLQVLMYAPSPLSLLRDLRSFMVHGGALVLTYPAAWPIIRGHLWNFTKLGMEHLLAEAGFEVVRHDLRLALPYDGFEIPVGYGAIAQRP